MLYRQEEKNRDMKVKDDLKYDSARWKDRQDRQTRPKGQYNMITSPINKNHNSTVRRRNCPIMKICTVRGE